MAWRAIQDTAALSDSLAQLTDFEERLYWRMVAQTDTWGRLPGTAKKIQALCVPRLDVSDTKVAKALDGLVSAGRIVLGCVEGIWVCQVLDFDENQPSATLSNRGKSRFPAVSEVVGSRGESCAVVGSRGESCAVVVDGDGDGEKYIGAAVATPTNEGKSKRGRRRDPLFEALVEACGIEVASLTETGRGAVNRALREIRATGIADPDEIRRRADVYRRRFSTPLTAPALSKHWASLVPEQAQTAASEERSRDDFRRRVAAHDAELHRAALSSKTSATDEYVPAVQT